MGVKDIRYTYLWLANPFVQLLYKQPIEYKGVRYSRFSCLQIIDSIFYYLTDVAKKKKHGRGVSMLRKKMSR